MFSSQVNSRDLFFSNPAERFLGNDAGLKTSLESGFGSSFGYSQNDHNKDLLNGNSDEIFTLPHKPQAANTDYQSYISQNLLFGKKGKPNKYSFKNKDNSLNKKKLLSPQNKEQEMDGINEIKDLIGHLHNSISRLNSDVSVVKDSTKEIEVVIARQNKRISSIEEAFCHQTKIMEEKEKNLKKGNKEDTAVKLQKLISENSKESKQAIDKLISKSETHQNKILETIRKNSTTQANTNKKSLEEMRKYNENISRKITSKIDKIHSDMEENAENLKHNCERNLETKIVDLKKLILTSNSSIKQIITSQKINSTPTLHRTPSIVQNKEQNMPQSREFEFARPMSNHNYGIKKENSVFAKESCHGSIHTPLGEMMKRNKAPSNISSCSRDQSNKMSSLIEKRGTPQFFKYSYEKKPLSIANSDKSLEIIKVIGGNKFRKTSPKNLKTYNYRQNCAMSPKPSQNRNVRNTKEISSAFKNSFCRNDSVYTVKSMANRRNLRSTKHFRNDNDTDRSSPYLTVYEATRQTEKFAFI